MRVYISVDMEGIGGIGHPHPTDPTHARYPEAVALMVGEANAAIDGAFAAGATEVLVNDSHWSMHNLTPADLDPRARLLQGQKTWAMVAGARDGAFEVALFVGYHARAVGAWAVPVGMVAGDDALAAEVAEWLPWAERVVVKVGSGTNAAASVH